VSQLDTLFQQGLALHQTGDVAGAAAAYSRVLDQAPEHFDALHLLGVIALQEGDFNRAVNLIGSALRRKPNHPPHAPAYSNRAMALRGLGRHEESLADFETAIKLGLNTADAHFNRAMSLRDLRYFEAAVEAFNAATAINPSHVEAHFERGQVLSAMRYHQSAAQSFSRVVSLNPSYFVAHNNLGIEMYHLNNHEAAIFSFRNALAIKPNSPAALTNLANSLHATGRLGDALASYDRALAAQPNHVSAITGRAIVLREMGRKAESLAGFDYALTLSPDTPFLAGDRLHTQMSICDWDGLDERLAALIQAIEAGKTATASWPVLALVDSLPLQRKAAEIWTQARHSANPALGPLAPHPPGEKIRLGYYSADFYNHATAHLIAELFERHDRSKFELTAFSFGPQPQDHMRARLVDAFDQFIDVSKSSDIEIAAVSRKQQIDIAVDLKGFTTHYRVGIFGFRAAPIQVSYLGYPGTMGADYIDYIVADATVIPAESRGFYAEKVVTLPHSYQVNDSQRAAAEKVFTRAEASLPETGFIFCCFNNNFKILPATFDGWMRILSRVPGSVLWLLRDNATAEENLRREAAARGVDPARLVFASRFAADEHLARHRLADLCLDTLPYNAHTTASDALWMGVPVLTCPGQSFAARVAAGLLKAVGLPELVADTQQSFEETAVALAQDKPRLTAIKQQLEAARATAPLFNAALFTGHIESAYLRMIARQREGLTPDHIDIPA